jgi:hypothetical protein
VNIVKELFYYLSNIDTIAQALIFVLLMIPTIALYYLVGV